MAQIFQIRQSTRYVLTAYHDIFGCPACPHIIILGVLSIVDSNYGFSCLIPVVIDFELVIVLNLGVVEDHAPFSVNARPAINLDAAVLALAYGLPIVPLEISFV